MAVGCRSRCRRRINTEWDGSRMHVVTIGINQFCFVGEWLVSGVIPLVAEVTEEAQ